MDPHSATRHDFAFAPLYRLPALVLGITPATAYVEVGSGELVVRFGWWRLRTPLANIDGVQRTGGFAVLKTIGPPHLSFTDHGVSFATNRAAAVCVTFHEPVKVLDPTGRLRHPGATLTVRDPDRLMADLTGLLAKG